MSHQILFYFIVLLLQPERLASTGRRKGLYMVKLNNNFPYSWIELTLKADRTVNLHKLANNIMPLRFTRAP